MAINNTTHIFSENFPIGTKAHAIGGGYWEKIGDHKWKWINSGCIFPSPGGDAYSYELPSGCYDLTKDVKNNATQ